MPMIWPARFRKQVMHCLPQYVTSSGHTKNVQRNNYSGEQRCKKLWVGALSDQNLIPTSCQVLQNHYAEEG